MTTVSIISLFIVAMAIYTAVNIVLWLLEIIGASIRVLVSYFLQKPHDFKKSYLSIRIIFTKVLLKVSFALLSPRKILEIKRFQFHRFHRHHRA